jgi:hypothetical protein
MSMTGVYIKLPFTEGVVQRSRQKKRPVHDNPENIEMRNAICEIERVY